jgi:hypothetical protein
MIADYKVNIYNKPTPTKVNGITIPGTLTFVKSVYVDIQPYSKALLIKSYGYDIEIAKRIFMEVDNDVKIGTIFYYTNPQNVVEKYEVKAIPWDDGYFEVMVDGI